MPVNNSGNIALKEEEKVKPNTNIPTQIILDTITDSDNSQPLVTSFIKMRNPESTTLKPSTSLEVFAVFLKLGLTSFGGPIAHLGYFRKELVERRQWLGEEQFAQLLAICQFLPGPASSQLGFCLGLLRAGWLGAVAAFVAFTLPSVLLLLLFAEAVPLLSNSLGAAVVQGLKLVACAVVADSVLGMAKKLCPDVRRQTLAVAAVAILLVVSAAWVQVLVVLLAAFIGLFWLRRVAPAVGASVLAIPYGSRLGGLLLVVFVGLLLGLPLLAAGPVDVVSVADVFYRAGAMVFGGGHVVLPLLEDAVVAEGWLAADQFLAGYGAAQAIPGPLFSFSAYLGSLLAPPGSGYLLAATALVFIFLPGFLLVAGVLPFWQAVAHRPAASAAIAGVNAAVVGLLASALYDPILTSAITAPKDMAIAVIGFAMLAVWRLSPLLVVLWCVFANVVAVCC